VSTFQETVWIFHWDFSSNRPDSHKKYPGGRSAVAFGLAFSHAAGITSMLKEQRRESDVQEKQQAASKQLRAGKSSLDATQCNHYVLTWHVQTTI